MRLPGMIHFFGPDGAGKSTQVKMLIDRLRIYEPKVRKCWVRSPHTLAFLLWRVFIKIGFYRVICNPFGMEVKLPGVNRSRLLRQFWAIIEFFSVLPLVMRIRFSMWRGYKFIAERFILDTVTTVAFFIGNIDFLKSRTSKLFFLLIPRDTVFIFLDSNYETIFRRRASLLGSNNNNREKRGYGSVPKIAVEPREFIDFQRKAYKVLAKNFNAFEIDTSTSSIDDTLHSILEYLRVC
ncbi:MAG: hypothetical protein ACTSV7_00170 [Candidatus Baldrarchaeia archaeon]